jgi:hypothetical protein
LAKERGLIKQIFAVKNAKNGYRITVFMKKPIRVDLIKRFMRNMEKTVEK